MVHNKENAVSWDEDGEDAVSTDNLAKYEASEMLIIINSSTPNLCVFIRCLQYDWRLFLE